ncbi:hypothetical protein GCM10010140_72930 [Streptosporangium pseudovulgare]|uniref:Uncharacterized protein n=1 Tax=Streptosporangium pseudovulgare TaxID=35765 RepID=A0ABQ2RLY4_9ACTN|nr:hypothetical protein GCM10010140_72930 [Streptosporangium pseudovulgare]
MGGFERDLEAFEVGGLPFAIVEFPAGPSLRGGLGELQVEDVAVLDLESVEGADQVRGKGLIGLVRGQMWSSLQKTAWPWSRCTAPGYLSVGPRTPLPEEFLRGGRRGVALFSHLLNAWRAASAFPDGFGQRVGPQD